MCHPGFTINNSLGGSMFIQYVIKIFDKTVITLAHDVERVGTYHKITSDHNVLLKVVHWYCLKFNHVFVSSK